MGKYLDEAVDLEEIRHRNFHVLYGKSQSGKTNVLSSYPKPMIYLEIGDDGTGTMKGVEGVKVIKIKDPEHLRNVLIELQKDKKYKTVAGDTFSLIVQEWIDQNAIQKKKRMTQPMWGDVATVTQELIKLFWMLALSKIVVVTCHEITDSFEGMEDEIAPDVRPNVTKAARTYLEAMANVGIHTVVLKKETDEGKTVTKYGCHLGPNPYYWTKAQKPPEIKLPKVVINPTYEKIMNLIQGG